jgi:hypothetical protein
MELHIAASVPRNPMLGSLTACARAVSGHAVAEPTNPFMKSRRRIAFLKA